MRTIKNCVVLTDTALSCKHYSVTYELNRWHLLHLLWQVSSIINITCNLIKKLQKAGHFLKSQDNLSRMILDRIMITPMCIYSDCTKFYCNSFSPNHKEQCHFNSLVTAAPQQVPRWATGDEWSHTILHWH